MNKLTSTIAMIGCFDTKARDFEVLYKALKQHKVSVLSINLGVRGNTSLFPIDYDAKEVARFADLDINDLKANDNRSAVIDAMGKAASKLLSHLYHTMKINGVIGMGGGGGTFLSLNAMSELPIGFPKVCISTIATKDLSIQIEERDIVLFPSVVDIAGPNKISRIIISQAAAAVSAMSRLEADSKAPTKKTIAISMFGNTTDCVNYCIDYLEKLDFEVLAFHAVGSGGRSMESLIRRGWIDGVLDITTTELADNLCGGICSAGSERMTAAAAVGIPQVVVPGCLDMVNFGHMDTVPDKYKNRNLYSWAPDVTLLRTDEEENRILGKEIANKLNQAKGAFSILIPRLAVSKVSANGGPFYNPKVDEILFSSIKSNLIDQRSYQEYELKINDQLFAEACVESLLEMMGLRST